MRKLLSFILCFSLVSCQTIEASNASEDLKPKPVKNWTYGAMISSANPYATNAGIEILEKGGTAIDAAIAVQTVLGLVEPQSSGIGGGAFMVYFDAKSGKITSFDGRETAPKTANPELFIENGKPMNFYAAIKSGKSVGVPGVIAMLRLAHNKYGKLEWREGFENATLLAQNGFIVSPRLVNSINMIGDKAGEGVKTYFYPNEKKIEIGENFKNLEYAKTLKEIALNPNSFYKGRIADEIIAATNKGENELITKSDLENYKAIEKPALCFTYRLRLMCSMRPPSSGGIALAEIFGMLEHFNMKSQSAQSWHYLIEAEKLAYIDRDTYVGDDNFVNVPIDGMMDKNYQFERSKQIKETATLNPIVGLPKGALVKKPDGSGANTGTSHFTIIDKMGNIVSMTTTVESIFGSQRMAAGFFLNNQLTDFSFIPNAEDGTPHANRVEAGKKPRSSMAPVIVFDENREFEIALGSPGGNSIIAYVAKTLVGVVDWGLSPQDASNLPNIIARKSPINVEFSRMDDNILNDLKARGHIMTGGGGAENSGIHAIQLKRGELIGAADDRREGTYKKAN